MSLRTLARFDPIVVIDTRGSRRIVRRAVTTQEVALVGRNDFYWRFVDTDGAISTGQSIDAMPLSVEDEGITWAVGWRGEAADVLRAVVTLDRKA